MRIFVLILLSVICFHKSNAQYVTLMCGDNQVKLDSSITLTCNFFTDSVVNIYMDKPYAGSRFQVALFPEKGMPSVSWHNVDEQTRAATFKLSPFMKEGCSKAQLFIMYQKKEVNIQNYRVTIE